MSHTFMVGCYSVSLYYFSFFFLRFYEETNLDMRQSFLVRVVAGVLCERLGDGEVLEGHPAVQQRSPQTLKMVLDKHKVRNSIQFKVSEGDKMFKHNKKN